MPDYDNTNSGVTFPPYEDQHFVLQGKVDVEGSEERIVVVKERMSRDGEPTLVLYQRCGVLFSNDKKGNDKAPDYSGPLDMHPNHRIAAWRGEKDGTNYLSLKVSEKQNPDAAAPDTSTPVKQMEDEIPF